MGLQLGSLQTGQRVNDVLLPPWAKSAKHFLRKNRAALESDYCTANLPKWIDLIFGAKSRGSGAKDARNLFHPMSYLGPADVDAMRDPEDRSRAELQSAEFGIVPDQLFCRSHPLKCQIGNWGDAEPLMTLDRLRESYGIRDNATYPSSAVNKSVSQDDNAGFGTNPFDYG